MALHWIAALLLLALSAVPGFAAVSLEKAKALRANGLLEEAKRDLVEIAFDEAQQEETRAEALLVLGEIALDEGRPEAARENWQMAVERYPDSGFAAAARAKLEVLRQLSPSGSGASAKAGSRYPPGTLLVVGPAEYPWAAAQIAQVFGGKAKVFRGSLGDAMREAEAEGSVRGLVEVNLKVDVPFESGRVICYKPQGIRLWDEVVRVTYPGSEEAIARRFTDKLATKVKGKSCP